MAKKEIEPKVILEREYIIPLRREWLKVPEYKRANKAIKAIKEFLVKHMKVYDRDLRKIKIEQVLNNEIRFRGMRKPQSKIKILAKKYDNDYVTVELINVPAHVKFARIREEKANEAIEKNKKENPKEEVQPEEKKEETNETKEKEQASQEEGLKLSKQETKKMENVSKDKNIRIQRKALMK